MKTGTKLRLYFIYAKYSNINIIFWGVKYDLDIFLTSFVRFCHLIKSHMLVLY